MCSTAAVEAMLMIPIALQEWGYEHGVPSDTPNEQPGRNCPSLHPGPRMLEGQNVDEHEDHGMVTERPSGAVPDYIFNSDDTVRSMRSWGEYRWPGNILC